MIRTLIIEDEINCRESLKLLLERLCPDVYVEGVAGSVQDAKLLIQRHEPDLVFLDIEIIGGSSFRLLKEVENRKFEVIFTTAFEKYAIEAFKYSALDYILKPINGNDLSNAIERVKLQIVKGEQLNRRVENLLSNFTFPQNNRKIAITVGNELMFVNPIEIVKCSASGKNSHILFITGRTLLVSTPLKELEDVLSGFSFYRVHHSTLINANHIKKYVKGPNGVVEMIDGSKVDVSGRKKIDFLEFLKKFTRERPSA